MNHYRSLLFMPGNNPGMLLNADILGSDALIFDLEDAVSPLEKDAARLLVRNALNTLPFQKSAVIIRVNALDSPFWQDDIEAVLSAGQPLSPKQASAPALLLPKLSSGADIHTYDEWVSKCEKTCSLAQNSVAFIPLIETALGIENAFSILAASPRITSVLLGAEDLTADLGAQRTKDSAEILYSRSKIVSAARANRVLPFDTPFTDIQDDEGLIKDTRLARQLGFAGKAAISPRHVAVINDVFSPSQQDISHALAVEQAIAESGGSVVSLDGKMIDAPIVARARQVLRTATELGLI